ncbi:MAG: histone deacetylase family protein [Pseudomonadales bacterium]
MLLYSHPDCLNHHMGPGHPERPERLSALLDHLQTTGLLDRLSPRTPQPCRRQDLQRVHVPRYLDRLQALDPESGLVALDPDTAMGPGSLGAAALAAGAVVDAVRAVLPRVRSGDVTDESDDRRAFCAVRPPGHHAEPGAAMGFCIYNNVAIGAAAALAEPGVERVAILDFDVHNGNGTIAAFEHRPEVLVCSTFQHPFYPHRFFASAAANVICTPLPAGTGSAAYRAAIERDWLPALDAHRPQLILVSAGFDGHRLDPLAELNLETDDYFWLGRIVAEASNRYTQGRNVSTLEGGYHLTALAESAAAYIEALLT